MKLKHLVRIVVVVMVANIASIGASTSALAKPASGEPLTFGFIEPFPGPTKSVTVIQALQAYVDDWNSRGGYKGRPIAVEYVEPDLSASAYSAAANRLINEGNVLALISAGICPFTLPTLKVAAISTFGAQDACGAEENDSFYFATTGRASSLPLLPYAASTGTKSYGIAYPGDVPGAEETIIGPNERYLENHPDLKVNLVPVSTPVSPTAADWDAVIAEMKEENVTALFAAGLVTALPLALQEARQQGFGPEDGIKWMFGPNVYTPEVAANPTFEGVYAVSPTLPWEATSNKDIKRMTKLLKGKVDIKDGFAEVGYQYGAVLERAMKGIKGPVTRESLLDHFATLHEFPLPLTPYDLDFTGIAKNPSGGVVLQVVDGKWEVVREFVTIPGKEFK